MVLRVDLVLEFRVVEKVQIYVFVHTLCHLGRRIEPDFQIFIGNLRLQNGVVFVGVVQDRRLLTFQVKNLLLQMRKPFLKFQLLLLVALDDAVFLLN